MKKRIAVVTGASSKVISDLIDRLIDFNFQVIAVSRNSSAKTNRDNLSWVSCDLADADSDFSFLDQADILFHAAAVSNAYQRINYLANNYQSTVNLIQACQGRQIKKIVYISSILAGESFGDYGYSKFLAEEYIRQNSDNWLIIRPSQLYGYSVDNPIDKLVESVRHKRILPCPVGDGKTLYPLWFNDLTETILSLSIQNEIRQQIVVVAGPKAYCYRDLIVETAGILHRKVYILPIPSFLILFIGNLIGQLGLRIGIYPDQLYRLFHGNSNINPQTEGRKTLSDYLANTKAPSLSD